MQEYTVVGLYLDNSQPWVEVVEAVDSQEAARAAILARMEAGEQLTADNLGVVEVFEGRHEGRLGNDAVLNGEDVT